MGGNVGIRSPWGRVLGAVAALPTCPALCADDFLQLGLRVFSGCKSSRACEHLDILGNLHPWKRHSTSDAWKLVGRTPASLPLGWDYSKLSSVSQSEDRKIM